MAARGQCDIGGGEAPNLKRALECGVDGSERPWASWRHFVRIRGILKSGGKKTHSIKVKAHSIKVKTHNFKVKSLLLRVRGSVAFSLFPLRPEPLPLNGNTRLLPPSLAGSFTLCLCELTHSR